VVGLVGLCIIGAMSLKLLATGLSSLPLSVLWLGELLRVDGIPAKIYGSKSQRLLTNKKKDRGDESARGLLYIKKNFLRWEI